LYSGTETKILNQLRSDSKYLTNFGFPEKCRIPSGFNADLESVTSLEQTKNFFVLLSLWDMIWHFHVCLAVTIMPYKFTY